MGKRQIDTKHTIIIIISLLSVKYAPVSCQQASITDYLFVF